jgi:hypothetical protein
MIPLGSEPDPAFSEEAKALIRRGLGKAEIEFAASVTAPLFWYFRDDSGVKFKNGTTFFLDAGLGVFAVTACHVVEECFKDTKSPTFLRCAIGGQWPSIPISLGDRLIDAHHDLDIATFRVTPAEVKHIGRTVLTGYQNRWPPRMAQQGRGVTYAGYPGNNREFVGRGELTFNCVTASGVATSVSEDSISLLIERQHLAPALGKGVIPENYDFGGVSGGPVIAIVETQVVRSWMPAGIIIQGPNPSVDESQSIQGFDLIKARPVQYILPDGHLDCARWEMNNIHRDANRFP